MNAVIAPMPARLDFMDPVRENVIAGLQAYIAPVDKPVVVYVDNQVSASQWGCCEFPELIAVYDRENIENSQRTTTKPL